MAVAVHEMISWRSTWVKLNLPKAFFSRDCNSLCLWILTVLSPAPQRNNKKKEKGSQSFPDQGDPRYYPRYSLWSQTPCKKRQIAAFINYNDFFESFLAYNVNYSRFCSHSLSPGYFGDLLKSKISLAAHLANNTPLYVISFEWGIKGAYWRAILTKHIQLFSNCIAISVSLHQGKVF